MPEPLGKKMGAGMGASDIPMRRFGEHEELANLAIFLMAPGCDYLSGELIAIDGAQWLTSGGNFHQYTKLDAEDWEMIGQAIRSTNQKDRSQRTA
jgi:hypothetical protein